MATKELTLAEKTLIQHVMFKTGIVPIEAVGHDMRRILKQLPPEEARKLKRKFRKLWRKLANASNKSRLGLGKRVPSRTEKMLRKKTVFDKIMKEEIKPMIDRFNNPSADKKD